MILNGLFLGISHLLFEVTISSVWPECQPIYVIVFKNMCTKGYRVGNIEEFLDLSKEESEYIELKLALCQGLAQQRKESRLSQTQLAKKLGSSQSRVAKMEKGDPTVSLDLIVKSLLAMGATKADIAKLVA